MKGITVRFKNVPTEKGLRTFSVEDCLVSQNGTPTTSKPQILIHLPKASNAVVDGGFVHYGGFDYHIIGTTVKSIDDNTPTRWNRYAIAERIRIL